MFYFVEILFRSVHNWDTSISLDSAPKAQFMFSHYFSTGMPTVVNPYIDR